MNTRGFELGRIGGIRIRVDVTFLFAVPLLAWLFARSFVQAARLTGVPAEQVSGPVWAWGVALAVSLFASVLLHELAHCWMLRRRGGRARAITLMLVGGATDMAAPPRDARDETGVALAGPVTSLLLGGVMAGFAALALRAGAPTLGFALYYLGRLNLGLGLFNLLPAFPMDGGRVLRGLLLRRRSPVEATRIAANLGKAFAAAFAAYGFATANLVLMLIGAVVFVGATAEEQGVLVRALLQDVRVRAIMTPSPTAASSEDSLFEVAERMVRGRHVAIPVCEGDAVVGFVRLEAVERMPAADRRATPARAVMEPATSIGPDDPALDALQLLGGRPAHHLAVVEDGKLLGVVSAFDLTRGIRLHGLAASQAKAGGPAGGEAPSALNPRRRP